MSETEKTTLILCERFQILDDAPLRRRRAFNIANFFASNDIQDKTKKPGYDLLLEVPIKDYSLKLDDVFDFSIEAKSWAEKIDKTAIATDIEKEKLIYNMTFILYKKGEAEEEQYVFSAAGNLFITLFVRQRQRQSEEKDAFQFSFRQSYVMTVMKHNNRSFFYNNTTSPPPPLPNRRPSPVRQQQQQQ